MHCVDIATQMVDLGLCNGRWCNRCPITAILTVHIPIQVKMDLITKENVFEIIESLTFC